MSHLKTAAIPNISLLFPDLFYGDGVLPAEYPARLRYRIINFGYFSIRKKSMYGIVFLPSFYGNNVLLAEHPACLQDIAILPLLQTAVKGRPVASTIPGLDTDKRRSLACGRPQTK